MHLLAIHIRKTILPLLLDVHLFEVILHVFVKVLSVFAFDSCVFHSTIFSYSVSIITVISKLKCGCLK